MPGRTGRRAMLHEIKRANRSTRDKRIKWHQSMDKKFNRVLPSTKQREKGILPGHRNSLVCPIKTW